MKKNFTFPIFLAAILLTSLICSCKKEILISKDASLIPAEISTLNANLVQSTPTPPLDWENISFMPTPPNVTPIPVPWQGGLGGTKIDADKVFDYHSINGWELVYNTFSTQQSSNIQYFMLYNKYRGVLRSYFYFTPNSNYPSSNMAHFLNISGTTTNSSILNFAAQEVVDINSNSLAVGQLQPYKVSSTGSWYAAEFEIAYDQNLLTRPFEQTRLQWLVEPNSITNITLNGLQQGDISGTITSTSGGPNFFSSVANGILGGVLNIGDSTATKQLSFLPLLIKGPVVSASKAALEGIVKGFLSGILGGTSSQSVSKVSLKINTQISISGTATQTSQLFDNVFSIPGTQGVTNTIPYFPSYGNVPGVFYIANKPTVKRTTSVTLQSPYYFIQQNYEVVGSSINLIFNPVVTSIANIVNIRKEVVILDYDPYEEYEMSGNAEQVGERTIYTGLNAFSYTKMSARPRIQTNQLAVRITFDVVPKDGSPKCTIVKTFLANQG